MTRSLPYTLVTAFSNSLAGGNPAAVIYLGNDVPDDSVLQVIANNLNQPIASYVTGPLPTAETRTAAFGIRWFAAREVPLCGHGTIAAAKAIWETPGMVAEDVDTLEFHTNLGVVLKVARGDGEWLEIELPAGTFEPVDEVEKDRITGLVSQAIGKEAHVEFVGHGGKGFEHMIIIELDVADDLANCQVDSKKLLDSGKYVNILTTSSPNAEATFHLRMLAPARISGSGEDPVCGSAHCLLAPYWSKKLGVVSKGEMRSKQVSPRGGDLKVVYNNSDGLIKLKGQLRLLSRGELFI
ncbi:hypothetical protein ONZ45_g14940 [Pleurotus djamor]|nr:hypothetical protein ONZ45_g14940 [Pleurotus djamor]